MRRFEILTAVLLVVSACGGAADPRPADDPSTAHYEKIRACWAEAGAIATVNAMRMAEYNTSREVRAIAQADPSYSPKWRPKPIFPPSLLALPNCESVARGN